MASPQVTVRMTPELYKTLLRLAELEGKNLAELTREVIEDGLLSRSQPEPADIELVLKRLDELGQAITTVPSNGDKAPGRVQVKGLDELEKRLTALIERSIRAAAAGQFYARQAALQAIDLTSIWSAQIGEPDNEEVRKEAAGKLDSDSQDFAKWWLKSG